MDELLIEVENTWQGSHYILMMNDRFPKYHFYVRRVEGKLWVCPIDDIDNRTLVAVRQYAKIISEE